MLLIIKVKTFGPNVGKLTISLFYDKLCCFSVDDLRKGDIPVVKLFTSKSVDS